MSKQEQKGRVIVTYGRSLVALMIAQSLGSKGIEVIGCDDVNMTVLSFSKFVKKNVLYTSPSISEDAFIDDLVKIAKNNKPEDDQPYLLIPAFRDAEIIARHKEKFEGIITVACPDSEAIDRVNHKDTFAKTTQDLGVESLKTWLPKTKQDLEDQTSEMEFPVFIKPAIGAGGRGISKEHNAQTLITRFESLQKKYPNQQILVQEMAQGVDYCFCGLFEHGTLVASMVYHNIRKYPMEAGQGVVRETVESKKFDKLAQDLMGPLNWNGVAGIDFIWDEKEDSAPMMIEVNPRFWAGLDHSIKSNVDFPYLLYKMFTQGDLDIEDNAYIGLKTSLPGLSTIARIKEMMSQEIFRFDKLQEKWPDIKSRIADNDLKNAYRLFSDAVQDTVSFSEAIDALKAIRRESKEAEDMTYADDDPFVGLGALFILGSLIQHGELPPEIKR